MHPVRFARRRPKLAVLLVVVLALVFAGVGYALWTMTQQTSNFEGSTAGTITLTINTPTAGDLAAAAQCVPGGTCPILAEVSNPSTAPIQITSYQASAAGTFAAGVNCAVGNFDQTVGAENTALVTLATPITVPAGAVNQVVTLPAALAMKATAANTCQGQTIVEGSGHLTLTYTAGS